MIIVFKLFQAVLLGILMLFSVMLMLVAGSFFIGFVAELFGFHSLAASMFMIQDTMWLRTKRWFFRYKGE
jgi:hypothetical protein